MWNYTEMYSTSLSPSGAAFASVSQTLADIHLSMIHYWGQVQRDIIRCYTISGVDVNADSGSVGDLEQASIAAAGDDQTSKLGDTAPEADRQSMGDALAPDDTDAEVGEAETGERGMEVSPVDEPVTLNAAMTILSNPALAAKAATRSANEAMDYEVRDDVADDIAAEIQREAQQELAPPDTRP